jgi:hypothetical protein
MAEGFQTDWEERREESRHKREARRKARENRRALTRAEPEQRPRIIRIVLNGGDRERVFEWTSSLVLGVCVALLVLDKIGHSLDSMAWIRHAAIYLLFVISIAALILSILELATYRPRLYVVCEAGSMEIFKKLRDLDFSCHQALEEVANTPPRKWSQVVRHEELVLKAVREFLLIERLRGEVIMRVARKIALIILELGLVAYSLNLASNRHLVDHFSANAGFREHLFFSSATFFTLDVSPAEIANSWLGMCYLAVDGAVLVAISYFIIAALMSAFGEFETNMERAARNYVLRNSKL